jgi:4'-phosphopantetheinyl transferase
MAPSTDPHTRPPTCSVRVATVDRVVDAVLEPQEEERTLAFRRAADRRRFVAGRGLAKRLVAELAGAEPATVRIRARCQRCGSHEHGKPYATLRGETWPVSIAHSAERVAVAATYGPDVGIDVERVRADRFTPDVVRMVQSGAEAGLAEDAEGFTRLWVHKEAILKCTGDGLMTSPTALSLEFDGSVPRVSAASTLALPPLALRTIRVPGPFCCAVAVATAGALALDVELID